MKPAVTGTAPLSGRTLLPGMPVEVGPLALGGNRLGSALDAEQSCALLDAFVELGGNLIDTALVYADWLPEVERSCSERTVGRWLRARGHPLDVVVATKGGHPDLSSPSAPRLDERALRFDVEQSLEHLGLDVLPLFWLHRDDPRRPVEEIVDTLEVLVGAGLIACYGTTNMRATRLRRAQEHAHQRGARGFVASQPGFSLAMPRPDTVAADLVVMDEDLWRAHAGLGLPVVAYSAQARGYFDKVAQGGPLSGDAAVYDTPTNRATAALLQRIAPSYGLTPTQLALLTLTLLEVAVVPVIGPRSTAQLRASAAALAVDLDPVHLDLLRTRARDCLAWGSRPA